MSSPPAAAAVQDAMAWKPPASPHEEQRVIDRAYAEYVLPADEAKRLLTGGVKSPRKPNGSPPRKPGSALSGSSSSRRRGGSHRQGQEAQQTQRLVVGQVQRITVKAYCHIDNAHKLPRAPSAQAAVLL